MIPDSDSDLSESSLSNGTSETGQGVGLSDPQYSAGRRKMLDLVNKLHTTGVQLDIDLPMIAVIGSQSAGKSSLIESISGITLPRASGTCTRCPTECRLSYTPAPWSCVISLRFITDEHGATLRPVRNEPFGDPITNKKDVEERIRRAQRAILNPGTNLHQFLNGADEDPAVQQLTFSTNYVSLQIRGSEVADLSFCDLPGLIASVGKGGSTGDIDLVKNMVSSYIKKPSCIILLTVACETDFENQGAHLLTKQYDPEGKRTIGVLTKPDRIPSGEEDRWIRFIQNQYEFLDNGWYSVKQPDSRALAAGITWEDARTAEREYFMTTSPWSDLSHEYRSHLGTSNLTDQLSTILSALISKRLPELQDELQNLLQKTEDAIRQLPKPPSKDAFTEILHLLSDFSRDLSRQVEGTPEADALLQTIRPAQEIFKKAIRATAPDFRPYKSTAHHGPPDNETAELVPFAFLSNEESDALPEDDSSAIYIDEVMNRANTAITRELPDYYPFVVSKEYIIAITVKWLIPTRNLFDTVYKILLTHVKSLIAKHFSKFSHSALQHHVTAVVTEYIKACSLETMTRVLWLLELEKRPRTLNGHYYSGYRDKFFAHYRGCRKRSSAGSLIDRLDGYTPYQRNVPAASGTEFHKSTSKILSGLSEIGIHGVKPVDLPKLLPSDPFEPALHIMAAVRAYFQVAYKRFTDNVPMAIDHELILGLDREGTLEGAIMKGLGITGPDGYKRCNEFLQEPPNVVARRDELRKKWERLDLAKKELMDLWL